MRNTCTVLLALALMGLGGCAGLPRHVQKTPSTAFQHPETTALGKIVANDEVAGAGVAIDLRFRRV